MKNKVISLMLVFLMLVSAALTACSDNTQETESESVAETPADSETVFVEETEDPYIYDSLEEQDLDGYNFRIMYAEQYYKQLIAEEYTGVPLDDAMFESKTAVEDRFNISISIVEGGTNTYNPTIYKNAITSDDDSFDINIGHDVQLSTVATNGYCYNLFDLEQFDFEQPWWPEKAVDSLTLDGRLYTASNYISYGGLAGTRAVFVNKDLIDKYNLEIPYDLVREGKWTFDAMYSYLEGYTEDLNGDGQILEADDQLALVGNKYSWFCMQESADVPIYRRDSEGMIYLDIDAEKISEFIEKSNKMTDPEFYSRSDVVADTFNKGRSMFAIYTIGDGYSTFRNGDTRYGFLPSPKLNELQEDYINACTDKLWVVPIHHEEEQLDIIGTVCEAMSCSYFNRVIPVYFEETMKARVADAPDDAEMLEIIRDTRTVLFGYMYQMPLHDLHTGSRNENVGSLLAKIGNKAEKALQIFKNNLPE